LPVDSPDPGILRYPYPIAYTYNRIWSRQEDERFKWGFRIRDLIKCYSTTLKYLGVMTLNDYLGRAEAQRSDAIDHLLIQHLDKPSLGHWMQFFREIATHLGEDLFAPEAAELFRGKARKNKAKADWLAAGGLIEERNLLVHPDIWCEEPEARAKFEKWSVVLEKMLRRVSFVQEANLVGQLHGDLLRCHGPSSEDFEPAAGTPGKPPAEGRFCIVRGEQQLPLSIFLWLVRIQQDDEDLLLFESKKSKKILYLLGDIYRFEQENLDDYRAIIRSLGSQQADRRRHAEEQQRKSNQQNPSLEGLWARTRVVTEGLVGQNIQARKYHPRMYAERAGVSEEVKRFLQGDRALAVIAGPSGCGKTNFICDLCVKLLGDLTPPEELEALALGKRKVTRSQLEQSPHLVLQITCRELEHPDAAAAVADELLVDPEWLDGYLSGLQRLRDEAGLDLRLLVIFDAPNEHARGAELLSSIHEFCTERQRDFAWLKTIVCVRTLFWQRMEGKLALDPAACWTTTGQDGEQRSYIRLGKFSPDELKSAYRLYLENPGLFGTPELRLKKPLEEIEDQGLKKLLEDPLILRYFARTYEAPPAGLATERILMDRFAAVGRRWRPLLMRLVAEMWQRRSDMLPFSVIEAKAASGHRSALVQYMFEAPYSDGFRLSCSNPQCREDSLGFVIDEEDRPRECRTCRGLVKAKLERALNTYDYLRDEGVLTEVELTSGELAVRFAHDRFFTTVLGVYLAIRHEAGEVSLEQRAEELGQALANPQLREAARVYLSLITDFYLLDGEYEHINSEDRLMTSSEIRFAPLEAADRKVSTLRALMEALLARGEPDSAAFMVEIFRQYAADLAAGSGCLLEQLFDAERRQRRHVVPDMTYQVAARAAQATDRTDLLLGAMEWGRPVCTAQASERLFLMCTRAINGEGSALEQLQAHFNDHLSGLWSLVRRRRAVGPLLDLALRILTVHFRKTEGVVLPLLRTLLDWACRLPVVGGRGGPVWRMVTRPLTWASLAMVFPVVLAVGRKKVAESMDRSPVLSGRTLEQLISPGPEDPAELRLVLKYLGPDSPAPDEFWRIYGSYTRQPAEPGTTLPSVKSGFVSTLGFTRLMAEWTAASKAVTEILDQQAIPYMRVTLSNALSYVALAKPREALDQAFLTTARSFFDGAEQHAAQAYFSCKSFAGMENYPIFQMTTIEQAAGIKDLRYAVDKWRAALEHPERDARLAFIIKNLLPAGVKWPREVIRFLAAHLQFKRGDMLVSGTGLTLQCPGGAAVDSEMHPMLPPLQELLSALHVLHRGPVEDFFGEQEVDARWQAFLLDDQEHARLSRFHKTKSIGRFTTMNLQRSDAFRALVSQGIELWLKHAEKRRFRPLGTWATYTLVLKVLGLIHEVMDRHRAKALLPARTVDDAAET